jgi:hypothetical protein
MEGGQFMEPYRHTTVIQDRSKLDMTWLVGRIIEKCEKIDYSWFFILDDGSSIGTESPWRLVTANGIVVASEDDGHPFGLPAPVNAVDRVTNTVGHNPIRRFELREGTSDLVLHFAGDAVIEFLNLSCGYEGWRTVHGQQEIICMGGGKLAKVGGGTSGEQADRV